MVELKTKPNELSVEEFLNSVAEKKKRQDCFTLLKLIRNVTKKEPRMWGTSIVGFGTYHYKYASGREGDWFLTGFSPRKQNISIYIMAGFTRCDKLMEKLGKHKTGKGCLYIKQVEDIKLSVLKTMINDSVKYLKKKYN